jgi:hypothetical protein
MKTSLRVFCSYSHRDEEMRKEFSPYLSILEREGIITAWHDRKIQAGDEWAQKIDDELKNSDLVLLFISAHFIQSNYAFDIEMKQALEMHDMKKARVVPILLRTTPLDGELPFERLQMIPRDRRAVTSWADRDEAWSVVTTELRELARSILAAPERTLTARRVLLKCLSLPNEIVCIFDDTAVIGRAPTCDIAVTLAPDSVGKQHARFYYEEKKGEFVIDDLESRNGTFVDGERVRMKPLRLGSRIDFAGALQLTFWRYPPSGPVGALLYSKGEKELARYVLAPSRRVGIGTTMHDAVQLPLVADGKTIGSLETAGGLLYYTPSGEREKVRLSDNATIDAHALKLSVRILD